MTPSEFVLYTLAGVLLGEAILVAVLFRPRRRGGRPVRLNLRANVDQYVAGMEAASRRAGDDGR